MPLISKSYHQTATSFFVAAMKKSVASMKQKEQHLSVSPTCSSVVVAFFRPGIRLEVEDTVRNCVSNMQLVGLFHSSYIMLIYAGKELQTHYATAPPCMPLISKPQHQTHLWQASFWLQ